MSASAFRRALEDGDLKALRGLWRVMGPHLPQPETDAQAEIVMHRARTEAESISFAKRAWSHAWLLERGLPSGLPDELRPKAQRLHPVAVEAVGISVNFHSPLLRPAADEIRGAMETAVLDAYAEGRRDAGFVTARMMEAKDRAFRALFGRAP